MKNCLAFVFLVCALRASAQTNEYDAPKSPAWLNGITRIVYTDLPNIQSLGTWPEPWIANVAKDGAQMIFSRVHSGEGWDGLGWRGNYGAPASKMGERDGTREVVALCKKHGVRYAAYLWAQREPPSLAQEHPEWLCVKRSGKRSDYFCANNPGYRELVRNRIVELVAKVGVDAIFFDMFHARADECYCEACKAKFKSLSGQEPPQKEDFSDARWQAWVDFKYRSIEQAMLDYNRAIKAANPEAALIVNTWNDWVIRANPNIRNSIRVAEVVDGLLEETGWYDSVDPSFFAFPVLHNYMSWHLGGLAREQRAFMWSRGNYPNARPLDHTEVALRAFCMMANGATPAQSAPGPDVTAQYLADLKERDAYFKGSRLFPWCGLVVSEKTELWYGKDDPKNRYLKGVYGAFQTMLERHLPVSLVTDRDLERGKLAPYRVLFAPNTAILSERELETLRQFVANGGGLVTTFETSRYNEHGQLREKLADFLGAQCLEAYEAQTLKNHTPPEKTQTARLHFSTDDVWTRDPWIARALRVGTAVQPPGQRNLSFPLAGRTLLVEPAKQAANQLRLSVTRFDRASSQVVTSNYVGVVKQRFGKGQVIYFPFDLTSVIFRWNDPHLKRLVELALREAAAEPPPVEVKAPSIVQAMTHQQGNRLVVHLLNDMSSLGRTQNVAGETLAERTEVIPIHDIELTFREAKYKRFLLIPGGQALPGTAQDGQTIVRVPRLEMHAMVVAE